MVIDKIVIVTKKTQLEELIERFNTREQARFYIEHMGSSFDEYDHAHQAYMRALDSINAALPGDVRHQFIERGFLPTFSFGEHDLVIAVGPDGLVVNIAKYLRSQLLLALNPDPERIDGILVPFRTEQCALALHSIIQGKFKASHISMACAQLNDGQSLHAVNDLFIGQRTHLSARYSLRLGAVQENQSSSGIIVSTGAGSTGWFRSVLTGAAGVIANYAPADDVLAAKGKYRFSWEANYLCFSVREPFESKVSTAKLVFGRIELGQKLQIVSQMPQYGVIFSDGIESDFLEFNSGAIAEIGLAERKVNLVTEIR
jgi:NAD kinase